MSDSNDRNSKLSRRDVLKLSGGAAAFTFLKRSATASPIPASSFVDNMSLERIADRDTDLHPPLLVDLQTHVWWRAGGIQKMTPRGEAFLKSLAGARANCDGQCK